MKPTASWPRKLNFRLSFVVFGFALAPILILTAVVFENMRGGAINDRVNEVSKDLVQVQARLEKTVELCNLTRQVFLTSSGLKEFLLGAKGGRQFSTEQLIGFYRNDVGGLEKLVNANPYLYRVRVYFDNGSLPEIMPILYHTDRMMSLSWARESWVSGNWHFEYEDRIFTEEIMRPTSHIMSLVTIIEDYDAGDLGVLEVAVRMNELMPDLYAPGDGRRVAFVTGDGQSWYTNDADGFWTACRDDVFAQLGSADASGIQTVLSGRAALVSSVRIDQLDGWYIVVSFPDEITAGLVGRRNLFLLGIALSLALLAVAVNLIVKAMLKRFYRIIEAVSQVRDGMLNTRVPDVGQDEVGLLGRRINSMLDRMIALMDENVKQQLSEKNSEIRALQSQINAHFIYNVLESIKMLAEVDERYDIANALTALGSLLRYSMRLSSGAVALSEEFSNIGHYITLINLRFDHSISLRLDVPPEALDQKLPRLTLQPIVENAVQHGIADSYGDTVLEVRARIDDCVLELTVTDYGSGIPDNELRALNERINSPPDEQGGIGLRNVQERIRMAFGEGFGLRVESEYGVHTSVYIRLPYEAQ